MRRGALFLTGQCIHRIVAASLLAALASCSPVPQAGALQLVVVATGRGDQVDIAAPFIAAPAPDNGVYISRQSASNLIEEIAADGQLKRTIGQIGEGPGEYRNAQLVLSGPDRVVIGEYAGVMHFYDSAGRFLKSIHPPLAGVTSALYLPGDTLIIAQLAYDTAHAGYPLHVVGPDGTILRSFGISDRTLERSARFRLFRTLSPSTDTSFWVAHMEEYTIELWSTSGRLLRQLRPKREWFPTQLAGDKPLWEVRPATKLLAVHEDGEGHLYTLLRRARADWHVTPSPGKDPLSLPDAMQYVEEVIEKIDLNTGAVLASRVVRRDPILRFLGNDRVFGITENAAGEMLPEIWTVR